MKSASGVALGFRKILALLTHEGDRMAGSALTYFWNPTLAAVRMFTAQEHVVFGYCIYIKHTTWETRQYNEAYNY